MRMLVAVKRGGRAGEEGGGGGGGGYYDLLLKSDSSLNWSNLTVFSFWLSLHWPTIRTH